MLVNRIFSAMFPRYRWALIFDCDTFGTVQIASRILVDAGAVGVWSWLPLGILSGPAIERLNSTPEVIQLICSDSIPRARNFEMSDKIRIYSAAPLLA